MENIGIKMHNKIDVETNLLNHKDIKFCESVEDMTFQIENNLYNILKNW